MIVAGHISSAAITLERFVLPLVPRMTELGQGTFFATGPQGSEGLFSGVVPVVGCGFARGKNLWRGWMGVSESTAAILEMKPSVLFVHTPATALSARPLLKRLRSAGVKLIYVARGSLDESSSVAIRAGWALGDPMRWSLWDGFAVANEYLAAEATRLGGGRPVQSIPMGAAWPNLPEILPDGGAFPDWRARGHLLLGWVGRLDKDKRPGDFVRLLAILNEDFGVPTRGLMIGGTVAGDRVVGTTSSPYLDAAGWCERPWELLAGCDLLVSTSGREGYGLVPLESAAVGTPAIAFINHGMAESVPAVDGQLVPLGDVLGMARYISGQARLPHSEVMARRRQVAVRARTLMRQADPAAELVSLAARVIAA